MSDNSSPLLLYMGQRNLRKQLQIDHQAQPPFQLKKRRRLLPRQYLAHQRHILQPQRLRLRLHRVPHINQSILIRHRSPRFRVLLEQCILRVVHIMQIVRVGFVNGPELLRLRIRQRHIFPNHLHFHCPYIFLSNAMSASVTVGLMTLCTAICCPWVFAPTAAIPPPNAVATTIPPTNAAANLAASVILVFIVSLSLGRSRVSSHLAQRQNTGHAARLACTLLALHPLRLTRPDSWESGFYSSL